MTPDPWVVRVEGKGDYPFEISLVRQSYELGMRSSGWFERDRKLLVAEGRGYNHWDPKRLNTQTPEVFDRLVKLAHELCAEMNAAEAATS